MAVDAYSPCPCGSGKKFKWCCQPIHVQIDKAFRQEADGQHEAALRLMDEVIKEHPANPEAYGRKAQLLYQNGRAEDAENTLQEAFKVNANYPFGHFLQGVFRQNEGEVPGALLLFRKAAELYDPEAKDYLGQIYSMIADNELKLNRPVAARAALERALHSQPANDELRQGFEEIFGAQSRLPLAARKAYVFQSPAASAGARRQAWDQALAGTRSGKLTEAIRSFEQLVNQDANDMAAWYNLGLTRAWLGNNKAALEALDHYVALEPDPAKAGDAWALGEVLRCGYGMEEQADYIEYSDLFQVRGPEPFFNFLEQWQKQARLIAVQVNQEQGIVTGLVLERLPSLTPELAATRLPKLGAYLMVAGDVLRLWHTDATALEQVRAEIQQAVGPALSPARAERRPAHFTDILAETLAFPVMTSDKEAAKRRVGEHIERFFEETWIHRPLRSLNLIPPIDAAGHPLLRKKLVGVVQFLQECAAGGQVESYDFDRLRRKLGLLEGIGGAAAPAADQRPDIAAMGASELAGLQAEALSDDDLEQAYQTALKLDARDLAGRFAHSLVERPPRAERPDRFPWYSHLVQLALNEGNTDEALNLIDAGEKTDCEQNEGKRRNEYELRRGQVRARRGDTEEAQGVFERLIQRAPAELRYRGTAAEAMLSAKQAVKALTFAEQGLAKAREKNDRDSEDYFKELVAAARRQGA